MENDLKLLQDLCKDYTVLYAEDDAETQEGVAKILRRIFKEVYTAADGFIGFELFKEHRPDLVITDIQMPHVNGIKMSKSIKALNEHTPHYHHNRI